MNRNGPNPIPENRVARSEWSSDGRPSETVVETVAAATDRDPLELDPIQDRIDADALDALVTSANGDDLHASFDYEGVHVFVASAGTVEVYADGQAGD